MSCELRLIATVEELDKCKLYLLGEENDDPAWLQKCATAVSPTGDRLMIACGTALVILVTQWDKGADGTPSTKLVSSRRWDAAEFLSIRDEITSVAFLPLVGVGNHAQNSVDWTCVVVGFSSGHLRFFTENMDLIASELLHPEPILHIKASSHRKKKLENVETSEAVYVVFPSVICSLTGFSLFQTLRGSRSDIALKLAKSKNPNPEVTLDYKKYSFPSAPVQDACFVNNSINNFDHLLSVSLNEGFHSNYRPSPPQHSLIASAGVSSWLQFQNTLDGVVVPLELGDVARTVINRLPGWLGFSSTKVAEAPVRPPDKLAPKARLLDRRRDGRSVTASPDGSLLAVSDSLGRVTLVDVQSGIAVRMWKGYRDAECGFLEVEEELPKVRHRHRHQSTTNPSAAPRKILLIAIFAPKKGLIELFSLLHGQRVAALRVSKNGRLLYTPHGLLGFNTAPRKISQATISVSFWSEEGLMDILVPFHCALTDASARAKDLHLLKQLKSWLREADRTEDNLITEVSSVARQLETDEVRLMAVDLLCSLKVITPNILCAALNIFLEIATDTDANAPTNQRNLLTYCKQLHHIVKFYDFLQIIKPKDFEQEPTAPLTEVLFLSESEVSILLEFLGPPQEEAIDQKRKEARVTFHETAGQSLPRFLRSLDLSDTEPVLQKPNMPEEDDRQLGEFLFSKLSRNLSVLDLWKEQARLSNISPSVFARCLLAYWLHRSVEEVEIDMRIFILLLKAVSSLSEEPVASSDYNVESPWCMELRGLLSKSRNALVAVMIAVCCRSVSLTCEQEIELNRCGKTKEKNASHGSDWENVSADTWQWDLLISHLEDVAMLNRVLAVRSSDRKGSCLETSEVSLTELLEAGEGAVSELTAKWLCQFNIPPHMLVDKSDVEFQVAPVEPELGKLKWQKGEDLVFPLVEVVEEVVCGSEFESKILECVRLLKKRFPYSLTSSALLCHIGWELMNIWQKDPSNGVVLASAIKCLDIVPSSHLKAGVCSLAWSTYLKVHFEGITRLVTVMGKLPTDTLCMRELGLPRSQVALFLSNAINLLSATLVSISSSPQTPFVRRREALWREGALGLVTVAVTRPTPCENVVLLHHQIATVYHMIVALELRERSILTSLMDSVKSELYGELTARRSVPLHHPGQSEVLLQFLRRAVSAAVQTVREVETEGGSTKLDAEAACHWLRVCCDLASVWRLPLDALRRQHVCELYSFGFDRLAEEMLPAVNETALLASQLLVVSGQRLKSILASSSSPQEILSSLSPVLTSWLNSLDEEGLKECRASLQDCEILMARVLQWLPEEHMDLHLATLLAESLPSLRD